MAAKLERSGGSRTLVPLLLLLVVLLPSCGGGSRRVPNVLLLVMDTTRADRCSFVGYDRPTTPYLERLARESTVYLDAWSPAGWTAPSHASMFTGLRPEHHGLRRSNRNFLLHETTTLAEALAGAGWRTGCITNNNAISIEFGLTQGFQYVLPLYATRDRPYPWAPETHRLALKWALEQHRNGEGFFLFVNDMEPHFPYAPPRPLAERFRRPETPDAAWKWAEALPDDLLNEHNLGFHPVTKAETEAISDLYDAEIRALDDAIEGLVEGLRSAGVLDDTLLIIAGGHGENFGDHGWLDHMFSLNRSICRVPLLVRYPGRFEAGRKVTDVVRLEDLFPTILEACSVPVPEAVDGRSLLGATGGRTALSLVDAPTEFLDRMAREKHPGFDTSRFRFDLRSAYDGRHQLILSSDGRVELYDVAADPGEHRDLSAEDPATVGRLRALLDAGAAPAAPQPGD